MTRQTLFEKFVENPQRQRIFEQERVLVDAVELVSTAMEFRGVNRSELAKRLNCSKAYITQVLRGNQNLTLKTLADVFYGLNCRLVFAAVTETGALFNRPWNVTHETSNAVAINEYRQTDRNQNRDQDEEMPWAA